MAVPKSRIVLNAARDAPSLSSKAWRDFIFRTAATASVSIYSSYAREYLAFTHTRNIRTTSEFEIEIKADKVSLVRSEHEGVSCSN